MLKEDAKSIADAEKIDAFVCAYIINPDALKVAHKLGLKLREKEPAESLENLYDWMVYEHLNC